MGEGNIASRYAAEEALDRAQECAKRGDFSRAKQEAEAAAHLFGSEVIKQRPKQATDK